MFSTLEFWIPIITAWLLAHLSLWRLWAVRNWASFGYNPVAGIKSRWRRWKAKRLRLGAHPSTGENGGMQQFKVKKIHALDGKGRAIAGTIEPVHPSYWLEQNGGESKMYLFALARRGRALKRADSLHLVVEPESSDSTPRDVRVKVLDADNFGVEKVSNGEYWDDVPEPLRFSIQDALADELMARASPSLFQYQGVAFTVSGLDELEALFPPE